MSPFTKIPIGLLCLALAWLTPEHAHAQNLISQPGAHTRFDVELDPHLAFSDPGFHGWGWGPGLRATWVVAETGFISELNDSVGIGLGGDLLFGNEDHCHGPEDNPRCDDEMQLLIPINMQWNFWFSKHWSAFGELGLALRFRDHGPLLSPLAAIGGRFQLNSAIALTVRLGQPEVTFGVSFFL